MIDITLQTASCARSAGNKLASQAIRTFPLFEVHAMIRFDCRAGFVTMQESARSRVTRAALALSLLLGLTLGEGAVAESVNWLDPAGYQKPHPITLNKPDEATIANKYWIDLSAGSGSTCSQSSPCGSFDSVIGKTGTNGGPAIIYVKGTGDMSLYNKTLRGSGDADCRVASCANWILIRTWPAGSPGCSTECTATITGDSNMNSPSGVNHVMFDGGPDLKIRFNSNAGTGTYANHIIANYVIVYRTQTYCSGSNGQLGWSVGDTSVASHVYFINNEFYGCANTGDQASAVYAGPGSGGGYSDLAIQNNIIRDFFGEGVEINPRVTSSNLTISGNAIHGVGKGTCGGGWQCRPALVVSVQSGGGNNNTLIYNNLMWDTGSGCIWDRGGGTPKPLIANNTCFDFGKGSGGGGPNPEGISGYSNGGTAVLRNNLIYAPNGTAPLDGSNFTASNNLCAAGSSCGSSSKSWSSATVLSTDPTSSNFMQPGSGSETLDAGATVSSVTISYTGGSRPQGSAYDIGAFESGSGTAPVKPDPPSGITVQ